MGGGVLLCVVSCSASARCLVLRPCRLRPVLSTCKKSGFCGAWIGICASVPLSVRVGLLLYCLPAYLVKIGTKGKRYNKSPKGNRSPNGNKSQFKPHRSPIFCRWTGQDAGGTGGRGRKPTKAGRNRTKATHPPGAPAKTSP